MGKFLIQNNLSLRLSILIILDMFFLVLHLITLGQTPAFNLDAEYNWPTAYQAIKLILIGVAIIVLHKEKILKLIGVGATFVGIDEWLVWHENTETLVLGLLPKAGEEYLSWFYNLGYRSSTWVVLLLPPLILPLIYMHSLIKLLPVNTRKILLLTGGCFLVALLAEVIGSRGELPTPWYLLTITIEEFSELIGASLLSLILPNTGIKKFIKNFGLSLVKSLR